MSGPLFDVILILHVASALVGFGAIAVSGFEAAAGRKAADPAASESLVRYFGPGRSWPTRVIVLIPVFGLAALFGGDRSDLGGLWPWLGLALWVAATGVASGLCWPAERRAQVALVGDAPDQGAFRRECARLERGVIVVEVLAVAAFAVMIIQP